jgi:hypothetical protein
MAALAYAISIALYHVAVHSPGTGELAVHERTLAELERRNREAQAGARQLVELRSARDQLELEDGKLNRVLLAELPSAEDFEWLDSLAESARLELLEVEVGEVRHRDFYWEQPIYLHTTVTGLDRVRAVVRPGDSGRTAVSQPPAGRLAPLAALVKAIDRRSSGHRVTKVELDNFGDAGIDVRLTVTAYAYRAL